MKIYDGFTFNDELDLLELRLETLDPVVDVFVIVEIPFNFRQDEKPMVFAENAARFEKWAEKIRYVKVPPALIPVAPHPAIEHFQRRQIEKGMRDAEPQDILMIGDVDEIPDPKAVLEFAGSLPDHPITFQQSLFYYHVNRKVMDDWPGTVALPKSCAPNLDCERIRELRFGFPKKKGGWHFSWLGSEEQIANKLRCIDVQRDAAMHGSVDISCPDPSDTAHLKECRDTGKDLFGRSVVHALGPIIQGETHPWTIVDWVRKYPQYAMLEQPQ